MYRDDASAARAHLASLVRALAERRAARLALRRYRHALVDEADRLRAALAWYEAGDRHGFRPAGPAGDLTRAQLKWLPLPGSEQIARALRELRPDELTARASVLARQLAEPDAQLGWLESEVPRLEAECAILRAEVEGWAARHPDHPPPSAADPMPPVLLSSALLVLLTVLGALIGMGFC